MESIELRLGLKPLRVYSRAQGIKRQIEREKKERVKRETVIKRGRKCLRKEGEINNETKRDREKRN